MKITPELVKEAYEKTGLKPIQKNWCNPYTNCACGLSALYASQTSNDELFNLDNGRSADLENKIQVKLDISLEFLKGFTEAFDGWELSNVKTDIPEYVEGYRVGEESRKLVFDNAPRT